MKGFFSFYSVITLGYWFYLMYEYPDFYTKSYLLGRAITWPIQLLMWIF